MKSRSATMFFAGLLIAVILLLGFVLALQPQWSSGASTTNYTTDEDSIYYHNLSANITGYNGDVTFAIDTQSNITWTNASGAFNISEDVVVAWISILDASVGNLSINATYDNQTGFFEIPIQATNTSDPGEGSLTTFEFMVNATNDAPNFTSIENNYSFTAASPLNEFLNASDEESHYPLSFNITFNSTNCTHAFWSPYSNNQNCSLFDFGMNLTHIDDISALINMSPTSDHVGTYWANISIMDYGDNYPCPHNYCNNATYKSNKTTYYSTIVEFDIYSSLSINVTDCQNLILNESQAGSCSVSIRTKEAADDLNISTYAILRNYVAGQEQVSNTSWFYVNESGTSDSFQYNITVNVTPGKTEIGNWTINFTVEDDNGDSSTEQIYVYVDRNQSLNDGPDLVSVDNANTSMNLETVINLTVYDDDLLIPDKNETYGGFNETIRFNRTILNQSDLSQELTLSDFDITILSMPVSGTNRTTAEIRFTANASDVGDYTINITVNDSDGEIDFELFNLSIVNNSAPYWLDPTTTFIIYEDNNTYLNLSQNVTDDDGDPLTFSYVNDTPCQSFSLNSTTGEINFTAIDEDVGQHIINITVSDGYLTNTTTFNFTILNINDVPVIQSIWTSNATPASGITDGDSVNATEDNYTTIGLWINDDDVKIPSGQRSFYDEQFTINLTIQGANSSLFNFSITTAHPSPLYPNTTEYEAIFTPRKGDVGDYNISINVTDASNISDAISFNLTVLETEHDPILSNLTNQTSAVNRSFYYDINVTDTEDGNDTFGINDNFTFSYTNLSGNNIFLGFFNSTTGIFNLTLNSSQDGKYHINITVNDSGGREDSQDIWVYVYGLPNISFPAADYNFTLQENASSVLNFTVNHSIQDNLTYDIYVDSISYDGANYTYGPLILRNTSNYYGNGTNLTWEFTPNVTDETYGLYKNLTLVVYPSNTNLTNRAYLNSSRTWNLNITHANNPVTFYDNIDDQGPIAYTSDLTIDLANHFSDIDYSDDFYEETVTFTVSSNTSSITTSVSSSWVLTLSASAAVVGILNITAADTSTNVTSNNFTVSFTTPSSSSSSSTSSGGGGITEVPVSLKIIMPEPVSAYQKDKIVLPLILYNNGEQNLRDITLNGSVAFNGSLVEDVVMNFSDNHLDSLLAGKKENITLTLNIDTDKLGLFEITVTAKVKNPVYEDWGKLYLTIKEGENLGEKILFTEEFIAENPECLEYMELIEEAKEYLANGNSEMAFKKSEEALKACRDAISQPGTSKFKQVVEDKLYRYLVVSTLVVLVLGVAFYSYKRMKLKRKKGPLIQETIKNKKYLDRY